MIGRGRGVIDVYLPVTVRAELEMQPRMHDVNAQLNCRRIRC